VAAAQARGQETIDARFFDGDDSDAFVLAVMSNVGHGLPLSMRERTAAARRIMRTHPGWSDRVIASIARISARTVAEVRAELGGAVAQSSARLGADGRVRPVDSTRGRSAAAEIIAQRPGLSLRQVAWRAGISPETVRDVRNRLSNGQSPILERRGRKAGNRETEPKDVQPITAQRHELDAEYVKALVHRLQSDRRFRESKGGEVLLRLFLAVTAKGDWWALLAKCVPAHCSGAVADLAFECSRLWQELADRIERRSEIA
jgi:hypothetical protein